jgi:hypothetical protein
MTRSQRLHSLTSHALNSTPLSLSFLVLYLLHDRFVPLGSQGSPGVCGESRMSGSFFSNLLLLHEQSCVG